MMRRDCLGSKVSVCRMAGKKRFPSVCGQYMARRATWLHFCKAFKWSEHGDAAIELARQWSQELDGMENASSTQLPPTEDMTCQGAAEGPQVLVSPAITHPIRFWIKLQHCKQAVSPKTNPQTRNQQVKYKRRKGSRSQSLNHRTSLQMPSLQTEIAPSNHEHLPQRRTLCQCRFH